MYYLLNFFGKIELNNYYIIIILSLNLTMDENITNTSSTYNDYDDYDNYEERKINIEKDKLSLLSLIETTLSTIYSNIEIVKDVIEKHNDFINFVDTMKIYEMYKWTNVKLDYNTIKKKINQDKKIYQSISKFYGKIISYFNQDEITQLNSRIKSIYDLTENMVYNFDILQKVHINTGNKCKYMIKNPTIIKIYNLNTELKPLIVKLYENYIGIKMLNKQMNGLKNIKSSLINDISQITNSKN